MKSKIKNRAFKVLNLKQFNQLNYPEVVSKFNLQIPKRKVYILRMLIKKPFEDLKVPNSLLWVLPLIEQAENYQSQIGVRHPFIYLTIRSGTVSSTTDDEWHVDGFSTNITHLPEQNYNWVSNTPTEVCIKKLNIPKSFNPQEHNLQYFIQDNIHYNDNVFTLNANTLYCMDPYVIHRRPAVNVKNKRTFIRVSFTPIEIADINNTKNKLIKTNYKRDGLLFRNNLKRFI